jgi:hypothetical protein
MIKENIIEDLEFLRAKLLAKPNEYISYNQLKGFDKDQAMHFKLKFDELTSVLLDLGMITEINSPIAGQRMFEKTDNIHLMDVKTAFSLQLGKERKEKLEEENLENSIKVNKWLLKTKWFPHIVSIITLLWSIGYSIFSISQVNNFEQKLKDIEYRLNIEKNDSKMINYSVEKISIDTIE